MCHTCPPWDIKSYVQFSLPAHPEGQASVPWWVWLFRVLRTLQTVPNIYVTVLQRPQRPRQLCLEPAVLPVVHLWGGCLSGRRKGSFVGWFHCILFDFSVYKKLAQARFLPSLPILSLPFLPECSFHISILTKKKFWQLFQNLRKVEFKGVTQLVEFLSSMREVLGFMHCGNPGRVLHACNGSTWS